VETADAFDGTMEKILATDPRVARNELYLQPVSIFWGRVPERVGRNTILKLLFPDDGQANPIQKLWIVLLHCRNVHVHFSAPVNPNIEGNPAESTKRVRRMLQVEFNRERTLALGPQLYDFNSMAADIIAAPETQNFLSSQNKNRTKIESDMVRYLAEISASFHYFTALAFERMLDFVWTRIFQGIRVRNFESIAQIAKQGSVIWMPCHRSHLDYMVLSYILKKRGIALPHIAAGINLNFWPVGLILRRSGAFFIRRSFQGNRVYSHAFSQYVSYLLKNGFPVEFFHEGGRTRIGKLLSPKRGMLNMCVASLIQNKQENCYFVPIYIGFEKVMEGDAYARELRGSKKTKESFFSFLASLKNLFENYGQVDVSFGTPIRFGTAWTEFFTNRPQYGVVSSLAHITPELDSRDRGVQDFVKHLARRVNTGINSAATASGTAILASILLTQNNSHVSRTWLAQKIEILHWAIDVLREKLSWPVATNTGAENSTDYMLQSRAPVSIDSQTSGSVEVISLPFPGPQNLEDTVQNIIHSALSWKFLLPDTQLGGEHVTKNSHLEDNLWWYRGNIFHLCAIPGIAAAILLDLEPNDRNLNELTWWTTAIRKLWEEELYWPESTPSHLLAETGAHILSELGVLTVDENGRIKLTDNENNLEHLYFFANIVRPERELYSLQIAAALELHEKQGHFTRDELMTHVAQAHRAAFLRGAAMQPAQHSQVFGRRVFDALVHVDLFRSAENNTFRLSSENLSPILYFFETTVWRDFFK
jgi:glycerol-3-phosphate O-acyltransferase